MNGTTNEPDGARHLMNGPEATVFVVDDEPTARKSAIALASSMGLGCKTFASAEEFLQHYDPSLAGCLLLDLRLDGMNGLELQERLAAMRAPLPVVLVSAYADVATTVRAMRNGALTVLTKPYEADELAGAVHEALEVDRKTRRDDARRAEIRRRIHTLSDRERELMESIIVGRPNKLIARDLDVSHRTVDRIRATVLEKMGAETAVDLARMVTESRASGGA